MTFDPWKWFEVLFHNLPFSPISIIDSARHLSITYFYVPIRVGCMTKLIGVVLEYIPIRVKTNTKLTNFMKLTRIRKYTGE